MLSVLQSVRLFASVSVEGGRRLQMNEELGHSWEHYWCFSSGRPEKMMLAATSFGEMKRRWDTQTVQLS